MEGLQTLKPQGQKGVHQSALPANGIKETAETFGGIDLELRMVIAEDSINDEQVKWEVENLKFSVKQPVVKYLLHNHIHAASCFRKVLCDDHFHFTDRGSCYQG